MIKKINEPNGHRPPVFQVTFPEGQAIQNSKIPCQKKKKKKERRGKNYQKKKKRIEVVKMEDEEEER